MKAPENFHTRRTTITAMQYTGKNASAVKEWVNSFLPEDASFESWFITKSMSNATGMQAWNYVKDGKGWGSDVVAAVYDYLHETWVGVMVGQWLIRGMKGEFYPCDDDIFRTKYEVDTES